MSSKIARNRKSVFRELGLDSEEEPDKPCPSGHDLDNLTGVSSPARAHAPEQGHGDAADDEETVTGRQQTQDGLDDRDDVSPSPMTPTAPHKPWYSRLTRVRRPRIKTVSSAPPPRPSTFTRLSSIALLIAVLLPGYSYYNSHEEVSLNGAGAGAGVMRTSLAAAGPVEPEPRAESPVRVCKRWAHQAAQLNGTLYIYGGQATTSKDQTTDTWNNNFLALDLTRSWDASSPAMRGLPEPSGPPAVSLGYLWNDYNNLYLYGGQFADNPYVEPAPISTWKYDIRSQSWTEYASPKTSAGNNSAPEDQPVQRAAEGAGLSVPELGLSWYFGGHLDQSTTPGWSNQIARVYLKSLLEFTHPGYTNDGVYSLADGTGAGDGGVYRNITEGGLQTDEGFPERADGVLVFVPGWGEKGVLIGLAGGKNDTFTEDLSTLDVYDIATSEWYHQQTTGDAPSVRVNPCAVIASAPDASSFQIYLYGGQNLQPYKQQTQYSDMYILTIPSFIWLKVPLEQQSSSPAPRAGHTCHLRDSQILILGGYTSATSPCEPPSSIHIFNTTALHFQPFFSALPHPPDHHPENSVLAASFGYRVPDLVASVIGGDGQGGATQSYPAAGKPTAGPFATGRPPVFSLTVTQPGVTATATVTQWAPPPPPGTGTGSSPGGDRDGAGKEGALIAAGVLAGLAGLAAGYLGYCAWLYRRQVRAYRAHLAVVNRYRNAGAGSPAASAGGIGGWRWGRGAAGGVGYSEKEERTGEQAGNAEGRRQRDSYGFVPASRFSMSTVDSVAAGWAVPPTEPRFLFDDEGVSPASQTGSGDGSGSGSGTVHGTATGARPDQRRSGSVSRGSTSSTERLLEGREPSFFSVVLGPRRALRVVNGLEGDSGGE